MIHDNQSWQWWSCRRWDDSHCLSLQPSPPTPASDVSNTKRTKDLPLTQPGLSVLSGVLPSVHRQRWSKSRGGSSRVPALRSRVWVPPRPPAQLRLTETVLRNSCQTSPSLSSLAHLLPDAVLDGAPDLYLANILENDQTTNFLYFQVFFSRGLRLLASLPCTLVCWLTSPLQFTIMHHTWSLTGHWSLFCLRKYGKVRINKLSLSCKLLLSSFCIVFDNHF